jgi:predicted TIM-barrel fold metal-dependent hydrolase
MKDHLRFVDSDMHVMEPPDLFERYLDPKFKDRVSVRVGADGRPNRGPAGLILIDGQSTSDADIQQHRKRVTSGPVPAQRTQLLSGSRLQSTNRLEFAVERDYNAEAQVMGMAMEGVDIAVLYPTMGLGLLARSGIDPRLSLAICQAYNNWIHEFCQYSPERLKFVAMLPVHDVHLACRELVRCVKELGAVGSFIRPNLVNGHYWHSNYWDPLYAVHEELNVTWGFHEGVSALYSHMLELYGENRFYRHVAAHWIEMQQALIAMMIGGVFEFHPKLRVAFLEAQNSWVPGLLSRIEWDYPQYRDSHAPYLKLTPKEYFRRNCWAAVEGSEPEIEATAGLIGADRMCVSSDYPHFDSNFPNVSSNLLMCCSRETAGQILMGGAHLYGFTESDFQKADRAAGASTSTSTSTSGEPRPPARRKVATTVG